MQRLGACNGLKHTPAFHNEAVCRPCRNVHRARTAFRPFCSGDQQQQNAQRLQHLQHATACRSGHSTAPLIGQQDCNTGRRHMLASAAVLAGLAISSPPVRAEPGQDLDLTITDRVFLDVGIASSAFKAAGERTLGDKTVLPRDAEPAGRIVIGLYGRLAPVTVANFVAAVEAGALNDSAFSRISPGEYIQAGRRGNRRLGDIEPVPGLAVNSDLASPGPFKLTHSRPGTVSLSLSENDEEPTVRERTDYRGLEFLITTGPGPVPRLDGLNPVFGRVESGMDTVIRLSQVPSFQPDIRSQQLNRFAKFLGDDRADKTRRQYGKPLKAIIILGSGVLTASDSSSKAAEGRRDAEDANAAFEQPAEEGGTPLELVAGTLGVRK